jgi:hypothetical protein
VANSARMRSAARLPADVASASWGSLGCTPGAKAAPMGATSNTYLGGLRLTLPVRLLAAATNVEMAFLSWYPHKGNECCL